MSNIKDSITIIVTAIALIAVGVMIAGDDDSITLHKDVEPGYCIDLEYVVNYAGEYSECFEAAFIAYDVRDDTVYTYLVNEGFVRGTYAVPHNVMTCIIDGTDKKELLYTESIPTEYGMKECGVYQLSDGYLESMPYDDVYRAFGWVDSQDILWRIDALCEGNITVSIRLMDASALNGIKQFNEPEDVLTSSMYPDDYFSYVVTADANAGGKSFTKDFLCEATVIEAYDELTVLFDIGGLMQYTLTGTPSKLCLFYDVPLVGAATEKILTMYGYRDCYVIDSGFYLGDGLADLTAYADVETGLCLAMELNAENITFRDVEYDSLKVSILLADSSVVRYDLWSKDVPEIGDRIVMEYGNLSETGTSAVGQFEMVLVGMKDGKAVTVTADHDIAEGSQPMWIGETETWYFNMKVDRTMIGTHLGQTVIPTAYGHVLCDMYLGTDDEDKCYFVDSEGRLWMTVDIKTGAFLRVSYVTETDTRTSFDYRVRTLPMAGDVSTVSCVRVSPDGTTEYGLTTFVATEVTDGTVKYMMYSDGKLTVGECTIDDWNCRYIVDMIPEDCNVRIVDTVFGARPVYYFSSAGEDGSFVIHGVDAQSYAVLSNTVITKADYGSYIETYNLIYDSSILIEGYHIDAPADSRGSVLLGYVAAAIIMMVIAGAYLLDRRQ